MVASKKERAFKRVGAYIRADARQSIRVSIRNSKPGEPPKAKRRNFKNSIRYAADTEGVVVGPVRQHPANSTPHILEASGWRQDTIGRIRARWEKANPEETRRLRKEEKAAARLRAKNNNEPQKRIRSKKELEHIREYYAAKGISRTSLTRGEKDRVVRFHIARRPFIQPAFEKNKKKALVLLGR